MHNALPSKRILVAIVGVLVMSLVRTASSGAQVLDPHTYTVHLRECPADYSGDDLYGTCQARGIPDVSLTWFSGDPDISGTGKTDSQGNITFNHEAALVGVMMDAIPFPIQSAVAVCIDSATDVPIDAVQITYENGMPGITFRESADTALDVVCDWYLIPPASEPEPTATTGPGSVNFVVHLRECPAGYTGNAIYDTCFGTGVANAAISWFPQGPDAGGSGTTDAQGNLTFTFDSLVGGMLLTPPFPLSSTAAYCTNLTTGAPLPTKADTKGIEGQPLLSIDPRNTGPVTNVVCDWYLIPPASGPAPTATTAPVNPEPTATTGLVSGLPNTGTGPASGNSGSPWGLLFVAFACAGLGLSLLKIRTARR